MQLFAGISELGAFIHKMQRTHARGQAHVQRNAELETIVEGMQQTQLSPTQHNAELEVAIKVSRRERAGLCAAV